VFHFLRQASFRCLHGGKFGGGSPLGPVVGRLTCPASDLSQARVEWIGIAM